MPLPNIRTLDKDGAIRGMAEKVDGDTRRRFLAKAGVTGAAAGAVLGGFGGFALAQGSEDNLDDLEILQFALVLEYLETAFYDDALEQGDFGGEVGNYAQTLRDHEQAHVDFLREALTGAGAEPVPEPEFDFGNTTSNENRFLETSITLEDTGVGAYLGAAPSIADAEILAAAGSILVVEAWHAAWGKTLAGENPAPEEFASPLSFQEVLDAVGETGFITSDLPEAILNAPQSADPGTAG